MPRCYRLNPAREVLADLLGRGEINCWHKNEGFDCCDLTKEAALAGVIGSDEYINFGEIWKGVITTFNGVFAEVCVV